MKDDHRFILIFSHSIITTAQSEELRSGVALRRDYEVPVHRKVGATRLTALPRSSGPEEWQWSVSKGHRRPSTAMSRALLKLEWRHSSPDRKIGLLYEEEAAMRKNAKRSDGRKVEGQGQLWLRLPGLVREALYDTVIGTGLACVNEVLEAERARFCGARYQHQADRQALRAGTVASSLEFTRSAR
jgi:hypothetical protein